jgi:hypothetical protein
MRVNQAPLAGNWPCTTELVKFAVCSTLAVTQMPDMKRLALTLVFWSVLLQVCCGQQAFLQSQLPLKVLLATPSELAIERATAAAQAVTLTGRQAITVRLGLFLAAVTV